MKRIRRFLITLAAIAPLMIYAQTVFHQTFTEGHIGYRIVHDRNGYIIAGNSDIYTQFMLQHIDSGGGLLQTRSYGRVWGVFDAELLRDARQAMDSSGSLFLAGNSFSIPDTNWLGYYWGYVVKTDSIGNMLWDWHAYDEDTSAGFSMFQEILPTQDSGCLAAGYRYESYRDTLIEKSPGVFVPAHILIIPSYLVKLDRNGDPEWEKTYTAYSGGGFTGLTELPDHEGYLMACMAERPLALLLLRLDINGDTLWTREITAQPQPILYNTYFHEILPTPDGSYWVIGNDRILKITPGGDLLWSKMQEQVIKQVRPIPGGGWVMAHSTKFSTLDDNGDIVMSVDLASRFAPSNDLISISDAVATPDGGFAILASAHSGIHLLKTDCAGRIENAQLCRYTATEPGANPVMAVLAPNPAGNRLMITLAQGVAQTDLEWMDLQGRCLFHTTLSGNQTTLDLQAFTPGMYLLAVRQGGQSAVYKVIKE